LNTHWLIASWDSVETEKINIKDISKFLIIS
jgi:hypothetical protein